MHLPLLTGQSKLNILPFLYIQLTIFLNSDLDRVVKMKKERKLKERQEKKVTDRPATKAAPIDRRHLHNYRVVQRNLVYVIGVPGSISSEEILKKAEYFGQYGKIVKTVIHKNSNSAHATASAYVTFAHKEDARACIQALEGFWLDGHHMRASFGTTKYCNNFIKGSVCNNPDCVYLHDIGEDEDRFTKEEIQAGYSKLIQAPGKDQVLITGNGGPSGTGRRMAGEPVLPPPVFIQDIVRPERERDVSTGVQAVGSSGDLQKMQGANESTDAADGKSVYSMPRSVSGSAMDFMNNDNAAVASNHRGEEPAGPDLVFAVDSATGPETQRHQNSMSASQVPSLGLPMDGTDSSRSQQSFFQQQAAPSASSFNGLGRCAVFPVPTSSLVNSIWTSLLQSAALYPDLSMNPYGLVTLSVSDLLEVTLPPVDAASLTAWPRPQSYYKLGMSPNGVTHAPPGQHVYRPPISSSSIVPVTGDLQQPGSSRNIPGGAAGSGKGAQGQQFDVNSQAPSTVASFKQIFPGVNMTFGGPPRPQQGQHLQGR